MRNIVEDLTYSNALSIDNIRIDVDDSDKLNRPQKKLAEMRLEFASRYIDDNNGLNWAEIVRPGTITVIDLRRRQGRADDALRLCLVVLSAIRNLPSDFHKFVLFDEFHEYYDPSFSESLDNVARMARHQNWSLCVATQNTYKVDKDLLRLFANKVIFQVDSTTWNNLVAADNRLTAVDQKEVSSLERERGECYILFDDCSDRRYSGIPIKLNVRPRVTKHGGTTAGYE
jgi:DNA phosphorothioation-dependent restriction protein DptH